MNYIAFFDQIELKDIPRFGGKNASLGQMIRDLSDKGIVVPSGFATDAQAYWYHLEKGGILSDMRAIMAELTDVHDIKKLQDVGSRIRALIVQVPLPDDLSKEIIQAYQELSEKYDPAKLCDVAVRSSATAEDLPSASFAGQQETFLNVNGNAGLLEACRRCMASLFTDRAIFYRREQGFGDFDVALSVGVQKMVRADKACAGVLFTLDTETGFKDIVSITSAYGLGETVVQGTVNPDEFFVHKPTLKKNFRPIIKKFLGSKEQKLVYQSERLSAIQEHERSGAAPERTGTITAIAEDLRNPPNTRLVLKNVSEQERLQFSLTDDEIIELARYGAIIEDHYSNLSGSWRPMDIEWAKDGVDGKLYILQARPETVHSQKNIDDGLCMYRFLEKPPEDSILVAGQSVGDAIVSGKARVVTSLDDLGQFEPGDIIVTDMTDPDWVPIMKKAGGIVTNRGGRTCHAAIVSRELGIPAVIGTAQATELIADGKEITIDCSQGSEARVHSGVFDFEKTITKLEVLPELPVGLLVNIANPDGAFRASFLPVDGVGLARLEFIISAILKIHPMAIIEPDRIEDPQVRAQIDQLVQGYATPRDYFIDRLAQSIGMIAGGFYPRPVIVRLTDFKSNEYRELLGGKYFEPVEENPMLGFRGAVRYCSDLYAPAFELECAALKQAREQMGFENIKIMVPFVRTVKEAEQVVEILGKHGLKRGQKGLELFMMIEIPSNVFLIDDFAQYFDGFSIGSNDLTQLTLGVDRDSSELAHLFDERDPAVKKMLEAAIAGAKRTKTYIGICGQAPSDFPEIGRFLIDQGINSLSLTPDSVMPFLTAFKK